MTKKLRQKLKLRQKKKGTQPVVVYKDGNGKRRFHGTKHLTATQILVCNYNVICYKFVSDGICIIQGIPVDHSH